MSRPLIQASVEDADSPVAGEAHSAKGHTALGLFVVAEGLDTAIDTVDVRLEVEGPDGEWSPIYDEDGTLVGELTVSEFVDVDSDGTTWTAMLYVHNVPAPRIRANITSFTDSSGSDLSVDAYVLAANNSGTGHEFHS
jgi:hypothetical protein